MTKEQAIEHIKTSCYLVGYPSHDKEYETRKCINEALDMAIKALEQQPSDDCVSRQAVIDYLYTNMAWYDENGSIADDSQKLRDITNLVNGIPPITPTHGTCKDCKRCCFITGTKNRVCEKHGCIQVSNNWYCADFEKKGNENGNK